MLFYYRTDRLATLSDHGVSAAIAEIICISWIVKAATWYYIANSEYMKDSEKKDEETAQKESEQTDKNCSDMSCSQVIDYYLLCGCKLHKKTIESSDKENNFIEGSDVNSDSVSISISIENSNSDSVINSTSDIRSSNRKSNRDRESIHNSSSDHFEVITVQRNVTLSKCMSENIH